MSYRNENESLEQPIKDIIKAIKDFDKAVDNRLENDEWKKEHIEKICELSTDLRRIRIRLKELESETW